jgi:hypothetical protein
MSALGHKRKSGFALGMSAKCHKRTYRRRLIMTAYWCRPDNKHHWTTATRRALAAWGHAVAVTILRGSSLMTARLSTPSRTLSDKSGPTLRSAPSSFLAEIVALVGLILARQSGAAGDGEGWTRSPWNSAPGAEEGSLMPATLSSSQCTHSSGSTSRGCLLL